MAIQLYADKTHKASAMCKTFGILRATFYRYLQDTEDELRYASGMTQERPAPINHLAPEQASPETSALLWRSSF